RQEHGIRQDQGRYRDTAFDAPYTGRNATISMGETMESAAATLQAHSEFRPIAKSRPKPVLRDVNRCQTLCSTCKLRDICLSEGLDAEAMRQIDALVTTRLSLRKGTTLYRAGTRFTSLYAIRSGSCKTVVLSADGQGQVAGYH